MGQIVDTETAKEFMKETLASVDVEELSRICAEVEGKSAWFRETLGREALAELTPDGLRSVLDRIFSARGKTRKVLEAVDFEALRGRMVELLHGAGPVDRRFWSFVEQLEGLSDNLRVDFAS